MMMGMDRLEFPFPSTLPYSCWKNYSFCPQTLLFERYQDTSDHTFTSLVFTEHLCEKRKGLVHDASVFFRFSTSIFFILHIRVVFFSCYIHATAHLPLTPPPTPVPTLLHQQCANVNKIHSRLISHQWKHEHFIQSRICFTPRVDLLYVRGDISIHISRSAHVWYSSLLAL